MPKSASLQSSFSSGELSPLFYGQADNPRYKKGLKTGLNILPMLQGPAVFRPGTKYAATAKNAAAPTLIPFVFSESQAYMLEFGQQYIRFYANNAPILTSGTSYQLVLSTSMNTGYTNPAIPVTTPFNFLQGNIGAVYATRANQQLQLAEGYLAQSTTIASGTILELGSPYAIGDVPKIRWAQSGDTLYLVHPSYPIYKLQRQAQTYWKLSPVLLQDGPYLDLNTFETVGDDANIGVSVASLTFGDPNFSTITFQSIGLAITGAVTDPNGSGQIQITTTSAHGLFTGQNVFITGIVGTTEANNWDKSVNPSGAQAYWTIQVLTPTTFLLQGSTFVHAYVSGGTEYPVILPGSATAYKANNAGFGTVALVPDANRTFAFNMAGVRQYGYITYFAMNNNASEFVVLWPGYHTTYSTISEWQLGVYSPGFGFPTCATFFQNRLCFGGPGVAPQEVDLSSSGNFELFQPSDPTTLDVADSDAISEQLNSADQNTITWLAGTFYGLLAGTLASEWVITPSSASEAVTPTNFNAQQTSFYGGSGNPPAQLGNATFYIQRAQRKVREMSYFFAAGTFRSIDMTELSEHLTIPSVSNLVVTKETQPIVWAVRGDGALLSMIYNRDDQSLVAGWTRHFLGGRSDSSGTQPIVSSIAAIPSPDTTFDQVWCVVQRYINGSTVYTIEYMTKIFDDSILQEDAFQVDAGATFYNPLTVSAITTANPAVVTFSGGSLSNGQKVKFVNVLGLNKSSTDANGNVTVSNLVNEKVYTVAGLSGSTFQLNDESGNPVSSIGYSPYISGGQVAALITTVSGLSWLIGETLSVLADGGIHPPVTVSGGGSITLAFPAAKVQVGYPYNYQMQLLRLDAGAADGTSIGKTRRTTRLAVMLHRSGPVSIGTEFDSVIPVNFEQADFDQADYPMPLFSGLIREGLESASDFESEPCITGSSPMPACIQALTSFMEEQDV